MAESSVMDSSSPEKRRSKERSLDDYKRKIWKLKKELEEQKELSMTVRSEELDALRKTLTGEKVEAVEKIKQEAHEDLLSMHQRFTDKETELSAVIKGKDAEISRLRSNLGGHVDEVKTLKNTIEGAHQETVKKLEKEIKQLKQLNSELQEKYRQKHLSYKEKVSEIKHLQEVAEQERQKLMNDALAARLTRVKRDQDLGTGDINKERELAHKINELTLMNKKYQKRLNVLQEENAVLKKAETNLRDLEEQNAKLKRLNADLANKIKSSGERSKHSLSDSFRKSSGDASDNSNSLDHARKMFARQRAKDFAEHAKVLLSKDSEIEKLSKRNLHLSDNISNATRDLALRGHVDLNTVLRQSMKEKMLLESKTKGSSTEDSESRAALFNLQIDYDNLQEKYTELLSEKTHLQNKLDADRKEIREIKLNQVKNQHEVKTLKELNEKAEQKCVQLTVVNNNLSKERNNLSDEVVKLNDEIAQIRHERDGLLEKLEKISKENLKLNASNRELHNMVTHSDELKQDNRQMTEELEDLKDKIKENEDTIDHLRADNSKLSMDIDNLLSQNESINSQLFGLNDSYIPELKAKLDNLYAENQELSETLNDAKMVKEQLETEVKLRNKEIVEVESISVVQEELNSAKNELTILQAVNKTQEETITKLNAEIEAQRTM